MLIPQARSHQHQEAQWNIIMKTVFGTMCLQRLPKHLIQVEVRQVHIHLTELLTNFATQVQSSSVSNE